MTGQMARVVWLTGPRTLEWREEVLAPPDFGEVLCETVVTAISPGTELAAWRGDPPLRPGPAYPRVQGYCNVAKVLKCGSGVEGLAPGDRVLTLQSHRSHFVCPAGDVYVKLTHAMDADDIVTAYLFHLGYNAVLRSGVRPGSRVVVIGLGALGLTSVAMAKQAGAEVFALSDHAKPRDLAEEAYRARGAYPRSELEALFADMDAGSRAGADVVILTTNGWGDFRLAQEIAGRHAVIACLGFPGRSQSPGEFNPLAAEHFYNKQLRIEAVGMSPLENDARGFTRFNMRDNLTYIARAMERGLPDPRPIVSGIYPARELERAYVDLEARKDDAVTFLLAWSR